MFIYSDFICTLSFLSEIGDKIMTLAKYYKMLAMRSGSGSQLSVFVFDTVNVPCTKFYTMYLVM